MVLSHCGTWLTVGKQISYIFRDRLATEPSSTVTGNGIDLFKYVQGDSAASSIVGLNKLLCKGMVGKSLLTWTSRGEISQFIQPKRDVLSVCHRFVCNASRAATSSQDKMK